MSAEASKKRFEVYRPPRARASVTEEGDTLSPHGQDEGKAETNGRSASGGRERGGKGQAGGRGRAPSPSDDDPFTYGSSTLLQEMERVKPGTGRDRRSEKKEKKKPSIKGREHKGVEVTAMDPSHDGHLGGRGGANSTHAAAVGRAQHGSSIADVTASMGLVSLDDVRSRVEDQVVSQLARASVMSMLYKQHKAEETHKPTTPAAPSPIRLDRQQGQGARKGASSLSGAGRSNSRGSASGGGGSEPSSRSSSRSGVEQDGSPAKARMLARPSGPMPPSSLAVEEDPRPQLTEVERLEGRFGSIFKKVMVRWDSEQDGRFVQQQWPELSRTRASLSALYTTSCLEPSSPETQAPRRGAAKLWLLFYKEIEWLQAHCRGVPLLTGRLEAVIEEADGALAEALQTGIEAKGGQDAALLFTSRGDLARYKARLAAGQEAATACWADAERWYHKALSLVPSSGKSYNQLAICELTRGDVLGGAFEYLRALAAADPFSAQDNLISLLDKARRKGLSRAQARPDMLRLTIPELEQGAVHHLLVCLLMTQTRTDLDRIGSEVDGMVRYVGVLGQRVLRAGLQESGSVGSYCTLLRRCTLSVLCNAWLLKARVPTNPDAPRPDLAAALDLVYGLCHVLGGEREVTAGWEEARGGVLVLLLEWLLANDWAWKKPCPPPAPPALDPRASAFVRHVRRLLLSTKLSSSMAEDERISIAEDALVDGLRGFLGNDPPCTPRGAEKTEAAAQASRCRLSLRALEMLGLKAALPSTTPKPTPVPKPKPPSPPLASAAPPPVPAPVPAPVPPPSTPMERICPGCTNMVDGGEASCEFCGHEFNPPQAPPPPPPQPSDPPVPSKAQGGGLLRGVDLSAVLKPSATADNRRPSSSREDSWSQGYANANQGPTIPRPPPASQKGEQLVVIDAPNVAMRHGLNKAFSCRGIALAMDYYRAAGHRVVGFLPDYYLSYERVGELRRAQKADLGGIRAAQLPDDIGLLQTLVDARLVIGTPPQDYDDSYSIRYAMQRNGFVVTNDLYRDHVKKIEDKQRKEEARRWLKGHCISFTFVGDEFLPNPDFHFTSAPEG